MNNNKRNNRKPNENRQLEIIIWCRGIETLTERYSRRGKTVHLRHLSPDCKALLHKAGSMVEQIEGEDPDYGIAVDYNEYSEDH